MSFLNFSLNTELAWFDPLRRSLFFLKFKVAWLKQLHPNWCHICIETYQLQYCIHNDQHNIFKNNKKNYKSKHSELVHYSVRVRELDVLFCSCNALISLLSVRPYMTWPTPRVFGLSLRLEPARSPAPPSRSSRAGDVQPRGQWSTCPGVMVSYTAGTTARCCRIVSQSLRLLLAALRCVRCVFTVYCCRPAHGENTQSSGHHTQPPPACAAVSRSIHTVCRSNLCDSVHTAVSQWLNSRLLNLHIIYISISLYLCITHSSFFRITQFLPRNNFA